MCTHGRVCHPRAHFRTDRLPHLPLDRQFLPEQLFPGTFFRLQGLP